MDRLSSLYRPNFCDLIDFFGQIILDLVQNFNEIVVFKLNSIVGVDYGVGIKRF